MSLQDHSFILAELDQLDAEELDELVDDPDAADEVVEDNIEIVDDVGAEVTITPNHGEQAPKFVYHDPESMQVSKAKKGNGKRASRAKEAETGVDEGKQKKTSRKRKEKQVNDDNDSDDSDPKKAKREITVYIFVASPTSGPTGRRAGGQKSAAATATVQRGPIFFNTDDMFVDFKRKLAAGLPCKESLLPVTQLQWHYEKPATDKRKPLVDEAGFKAMQTSLRERKKDLVINVHMPPPKRDDTPWDTGKERAVVDAFDFDSEAVSQIPEALSAKEQIAAIGRQSSEHVAALKTRYPKGQYVMFPDKHVYKKNNRYWELTDFVLRVWAARIVKGEATIEEAPNTPHFDDAHKLRLPAGHSGDQVGVNDHLPREMGTNKENLPAATVPGYNMYAPTHPPYYAMPPYPPYYPTPPVPAHQPFHMMGYNHYPPPSFPYNMIAGTQPGPAAPSPQPLPREALRLGIPLENFCERYGIPDTDQAKLLALEYRPGMPGVEKLNEREWKDIGFSALGWEFFKDAHKQFLRDVRDGKWVPL